MGEFKRRTRMTMNRKDLIFRVWKLFHPLHDRTEYDYLWSTNGHLSLVNTLARDLWVYNILDNEDTKELRFQMEYLDEHGVWPKDKE
jgi:hypothetical protein